jgi:hypothetical protein
MVIFPARTSFTLPFEANLASWPLLPLKATGLPDADLVTSPFEVVTVFVPFVLVLTAPTVDFEPDAGVVLPPVEPALVLPPLADAVWDVLPPVVPGFEAAAAGLADAAGFAAGAAFAGAEAVFFAWAAA